MKLSFSTNAFTRHTLSYAVEKIAEAGYSGIEILADTPHLYPPAIGESDLDRLAALLREKNLHVANINANTACGYYGRSFWEPLFEPSLANPEPEARRWRIDYTKRCIAMAARLSCPNVSVTSGRMVPGIRPEDSLKLLTESLREVLDHAAAHSVRIGMEYEPGLLVECCRELCLLIDRLGADNFGANLDFGHSHILGENPREVVSALSGRIFHVHMEDIRGAKHYHLVPGDGDIDFGLLFDTLSEAGYRDHITVELYTYPENPGQAAARAFHYLSSLGKKGSHP